MMVVVAAVVALIASATPAQADASDCPRGYLCMWEHAYYAGDMLVKEKKPDKKGQAEYRELGVAADNDTSSFVNNTGCDLEVNLQDLDGLTWGEKGNRWYDADVTHVGDLTKWTTQQNGFSLNDNIESIGFFCH